MQRQGERGRTDGIRAQIINQLCRKDHRPFEEPPFPEYHAIDLDQLCPKCREMALQLIEGTSMQKTVWPIEGNGNIENQAKPPQQTNEILSP